MKNFLNNILLVIFVLAIFVFGSTIANADPKIFEFQNFESPGTSIPSGWSTAYVSGTTDWLFNTVAGVGGRLSSGVFTTDHTLGTASGHLAAFDSYNGAAGTQTRLISPVFDFTSVANPVFTFWWADGYDSYKDSMTVDFSTDGGSTWGPLEPTYVKQPIGTATNTWVSKTIDITRFGGMNYIRFAFRGISNYGNRIGIDDITIGFTPVNDEGVTAITLPGSNAYNTANQITATIKNFGTAAQTIAFTAYVKIWQTSGGSESSPEFTTNEAVPSLTSGSTTSLAFTSKWTPAAYTAYTVKIYTVYSGGADDNPANDVWTKAVTVVPQTDLQISSIVYPAVSGLYAGTLGYSVACTIKNNGTTTVSAGSYTLEAWIGLTSGFPTDADYFSMIGGAVDINSGATSGTLNLLPTWVPAVPGNYTVRFKVTIAGDEVSSNDQQDYFRTVSSYNYGGGGSGTGDYYFANTTSDAINNAPSYPTYSWIDPISAGHTLLTSWASGNADDGYSAALTLPFSFSYFGNSYSGIYTGSNGIVTFGAGSSSSSYYSAFLTSSSPNNLIAGAWTDLDNTTATYSDAHIYYGGDANKFVVTFWHSHKKSSSDYITFQIILFPNGNIKIQYNDAETTNPSPSSIINLCAVGIEDINGTLGIKYRMDGTGGAMFGSPLAVEFGPNSSAFSAMSLSLTALFEAMWVSGGETSMPNPAPVTVELHDASTYALVEAQTATIGTDGVGTFNFASAVNGTPYYIVVKSPTTVETWSAAAHSFTAGALSYDFTTGVGQAYTDGSMDPLKLYSGKYCLYSGDANQDGFVTSDDFTGIDNDVNIGDYHVENDLNGDLFVTSDDFTFVDNNISLGVMRQVPPGAPSHLVKGAVKSHVQQKGSVN